MGFGLFNSESKVTNSTQISSWENSFNTSNSSSNVVSEAGNINLNIDRQSAIQQAIPIVAMVAIGLGVLVALRKS